MLTTVICFFMLRAKRLPYLYMYSTTVTTKTAAHRRGQGQAYLIRAGIARIDQCDERSCSAIVCRTFARIHFNSILE